MSKLIVNSDYIFSPIKYDDESFIKYSKFLNFVFIEKIPKTLKFINWEYNQNPLGKAFGYDAFYKNDLVAHYSAQPIECLIDGIQKKGLLALHVATHPEHQGKSLFSVINNLTHEKALSEGYEFVVGIANKNSTPRYVKALGFKLLGSLEAKIGINYPQYKFNAKNSISFKRIWTSETVKWRLKDPSYLHQLKKHNDYISVIAPTHIKGIGAIVNQFGITDYPDVIKDYCDKKNKYYPLKIWLGIDKNMKWKTSVNIPSRLRPSPLNLIYLNLKDPGHSLGKENIYFYNLDFDAF